jgi:hypothetical protein
MRYADGGGLSPAQRLKREQVRFAAGRMFAQGTHNVQVARSLRVSQMSVSRWRRAFEGVLVAGLRPAAQSG